MLPIVARRALPTGDCALNLILVKLQLNEAAGHTTHVYEAVSRIVAGGISGLLVGLAVRSHLIGGNVFQGTQADLLMLVLAMAAGTGERFATSIINKVHPVTPSKPAPTP